ncbi:hypothetical protein ACS0TY_005470 [Phlomoides rotata]
MICFKTPMKSNNSVCVLEDIGKSRSCICTFLITMSLISGAYFIATASLRYHSFMLSTGLRLNTDSVRCEVSPIQNDAAGENRDVEKCNEKCRPVGTELLPQGIVSKTSNLEMYPLSGPAISEKHSSSKHSLLALAVGYAQKELVNQIVEKFLGEEFGVMLFHYDGVVDEWNDLEWSTRVIHVSAINQTKWWFAKRFLHPDIVAEYDYIFLWDEDLGLDNFHPRRYVSIIEEEGLEISQPALDPAKSHVHHRITVRHPRSRVHRRYYRFQDGGSGRCDRNSSAPPCVGWVEMMAPVFSRAAWRCAWYMIQNDLIHAWGLDKQLGYCAQGDRTIKVGVVDEEYILHLGLPTLGAATNNLVLEISGSLDKSNNRSAVRLRSYAEMRSFRNRWNQAVKEDECWVDPFIPPTISQHI